VTESTGAKRWLEENISKKGITRAGKWYGGEVKKSLAAMQDKSFDVQAPGLGIAEHVATGPLVGAKSLKGIYQTGKSMFSKWKGGKSVASTISKEAVKSTGKGQKGFRDKLFADSRIAKGAGYGGSNSGYTSLNKQFAASMKGANWKSLGKSKHSIGGLGNLDVSVADKLMTYSGRQMTAVKLKGKAGEIIQPFYRSTGFGEPAIKSKGKFLPFEGLLPKKLHPGYSSKPPVIGGESLAKYNVPIGWMMKGFKQHAGHGTRGKSIFSTTKGPGIVGMKEGLPIHQEVGSMLQRHFK